MTMNVSAPEPALARPAADAWFLDARPTLLPGVEELPGLDNKPMLYQPISGKYVALTPAAVKISRMFDGSRTGREILARIGVTPQDDAAPRVARMAAELRQLGFLTEPAHAEDTRTRISRFAAREHMWRWELVRDAGRFLEPLAAPLRRFSGLSLIAVWSMFTIAGLVTGIYAITHVRVEAMPPHLWLVLPILVLQIVIHEFAHAIVCQYLGAPVRSAGFGLMLYVMPVGYVDRTDSHRVTSRSGRVAISLAGPMSDQIWFGVTGLVALSAGPELRSFAVVLMVLQILLTIMNFNPLTPSDGYHAATAAFGIVNLRGKSFALLLHRVIHSPLPPTLERISTRERRIMTGYGALCLLFALALGVAAVRTAIRVIGVLT